MKADTGANDLLPTRAGETDEERRLREAINRHGGQIMAAVDAAIRMRTAPAEAQKARHRARNHLLDFAVTAMHAHVISGSS